ncbi:MAG: hypothetical protein KGD65_16830 [Candidatus Lokiarchaeota archaeon]|nr:hypothetical protein [Candidatus Lokiarchaeota archaeon]
MNEIEREIDWLLGWYDIKRKYYIGLALTVLGTFILIVKIILLQQFLPYGVSYHHDVIVYNGDLIRLYVGVIMGSIGVFLLLIGLPLLIIYTSKKNKLGISS